MASRKGPCYDLRGAGDRQDLVGLNIAHAVAGAGAFLRWHAPQARRVVYVDGEMPASALKERYASIVAGAGFDAPADGFRLIAADLQADGLPDLADPNAQRFCDRANEDANLIIVDNLSTVFRALRENEADSWGPVQAWCLRQRAAGKSVLLIHHAGKAGFRPDNSDGSDASDRSDSPDRGRRWRSAMTFNVPSPVRGPINQVSQEISMHEETR